MDHFLYATVWQRIITTHAHSAKDVIRRMPRTTCATLLCDFSQCTWCPRTSPSDTGSWIEDTRLKTLVSTTRPQLLDLKGGGEANLDSVLPCRRMRHISEAHIGRTPQKININSALFDCKM